MLISKQGSTPTPWGAGSARPNSKTGAPDPENPLFPGFSVLRGGVRPWSRKGADHGVGVDPETLSLEGRNTFAECDPLACTLTMSEIIYLFYAALSKL